jgi:hypothetical protein
MYEKNFVIKMLATEVKNSSSHSNLHTSSELFIGLLGYHSTAVLVSSAAFLLQRASTDGHLVALVKLVTGGICNSTSASQFEQVCIKLKYVYVCVLNK